MVILQITCALKGDTAYISKWTSASSTDVYVSIKDYKAKGATNAEVYVNSEGGSVFEAEEIINLLNDNFGRENVTVKVGALAASAGTAFCTEFHTVAKANSQFMIHKPKVFAEGSEDELENTLKLIKDVTARYRGRYAKKMGITEDQVDALWAKGDYWMTATEAKDQGLIDEIEDGEEKIDAESRLRLAACGAPNIPKPQKQKTIIPDTDMKLPELAASLGLPLSASQEQVDQRIKELKKSETDLTALKQSNSQKEKAEKAQKVKALLDKAEKDRKITGEQRGHYQKLAEADYDSCAAILEDMPTIEALSGRINPTGKSVAKGRENWTYADYQKNPKAWVEFEKNNPEKAQELIEAHYKED